jgi:hypothetical protein
LTFPGVFNSITGEMSGSIMPTTKWFHRFFLFQI